MRKTKRYLPEDALPVELPNAISGYEKESREAEAKLADVRKAAKKKPTQSKKVPARATVSGGS